MATLYTKTNPPTVHNSDRPSAGQPATWRLVHDGAKVLSLHQSTGVTSTINNMVVGTLDEVNAEITALKLTPLPARPEKSCAPGKKLRPHLWRNKDMKKQKPFPATPPVVPVPAPSVPRASVGTGSTRSAFPEQVPFTPQTGRKVPASSVGAGQAKR